MKKKNKILEVQCKGGDYRLKLGIGYNMGVHCSSENRLFLCLKSASTGIPEILALIVFVGANSQDLFL